MSKRVMLAMSLLLSTSVVSAAPDQAGFWKSDPYPGARVGSAPPQLLHIRKSGNGYFIELVEFVPAASTFVVREVPAAAKDAGLRYAGRQFGEEFILYDEEKKALLGGICKLPCRQVDASQYDAGKKAALAWKPKSLSDFVPK